MNRFPHLLPLVLLVAVLTVCTGTFASEASPTFAKEVEPILSANCYRCHAEKTRKAELDLSSAGGLLRGSESGQIIDVGNPEESLLWEVLDEGLMPPEKDKQLAASEIEIIRRWIAAGASLGDDRGADDVAAVAQHDVTPILLRRCTVCHGSQHVEGELDLRTKAQMLKGGNSGPAIVEGNPGSSALVRRVRERLCPPKKDIGEAGIEPMTPDELEVVEKWISLGAPLAPAADSPSVTPQNDPLVDEEDRQFWSFQSPKQSAPPKVADADRVRNPIDTFLLAKLEEKGLSFSPEASKLTLLRRATFDLTGLPPSPDEITEFLEDESPRAYERLIDRLLDSQRYGERWGRMWLDLAGYADSEGKRNADTVRPWAWRYRDYVIRSFNEDKPYDQFLLEQIAGDELVDYAADDAVTEKTIEKMVATGFLRMAPDGTSADPVNRISDRVEVIGDEIDVLGRGVMGLTLNCARCHSHKYDPLPQRDYYRLVAVFKGAYDEYDWLVPQPFTNQWKKAQPRYLTLATADERRQVEEHNRPLREQIEQLQASLKEKSADKKDAKQINDKIKSLKSKLQELPKIRALWDRGQPSPTYVYRRGDEMQPASLVEPGVPSALTAAAPPVGIQPLRHSTRKTGRRLALARWLVQPTHPLTARVFVNRVWKQHFGVGIVKSLDNFGKLGTPPSHPELLDWLAVKFVEHGWSIKQLHRLMMTSTAYRQSSTINSAHQQLDPENRLVSRMPMRRMSAEEVRDSILLISGRLNETPFGKPDPVDVRKDGLVTSKPTDGRWRRSIYVRQRRKEMPSILETFDLPQMNPNCVERMDSTVVSQPLHLLNNRMIYDLAGSLAERVKREAGPDLQKQIEIAWMVALNRPPTDEELKISLQSLNALTGKWEAELGQDAPLQTARENALRDHCHALINSAAFLYID